MFGDFLFDFRKTKMIKLTIILLILLLLPVSARVDDELIWDTCDSLTWVDDIVIDSVIIYHDTLREYVVEIKETCDTIFYEWVEILRSGKLVLKHLDSLVCTTDTIWADKVQVWLTLGEIIMLDYLLHGDQDTVPLGSGDFFYL